MAAGIDVSVARLVISVVEAEASHTAIVDQIVVMLLAGHPKHPHVRLHEASQRRGFSVERSAFELRAIQATDQMLSSTLTL